MACISVARSFINFKPQPHQNAHREKRQRNLVTKLCVTVCKMYVTPFTHKNGRTHQWQTSVSSSVRFARNNHCNLLLSLHLGQWWATLPACFQLSFIQKAAPLERKVITTQVRAEHYTEHKSCPAVSQLTHSISSRTRHSILMSFILSPEKMMHLKHWDYSQNVTLLRCELNGCKAGAKADFQNNCFDQEHQTTKGRKLLSRKTLPSWQTTTM